MATIDGVAAPIVFVAAASVAIEVVLAEAASADLIALAGQAIEVVDGQCTPIAFTSVPDPPAGAYRMRAYDTTLLRFVYWDAPAIDTLGSTYSGPGPLSDIVVFMYQGAGL